MKISFRLSDTEVAYSGTKLPSTNINAQNIDRDLYILTPGKILSEIPKEAEIAYINAETYGINGKYYDLTSGYCVEARIYNGIITPLLREARGEEKKVFQKLVKPRFGYPFRTGPLTEHWPKVTEHV